MSLVTISGPSRASELVGYCGTGCSRHRAGRGTRQPPQFTAAILGGLQSRTSLIRIPGGRALDGLAMDGRTLIHPASRSQLGQVISVPIVSSTAHPNPIIAHWTRPCRGPCPRRVLTVCIVNAPDGADLQSLPRLSALPRSVTPAPGDRPAADGWSHQSEAQLGLSGSDSYVDEQLTPFPIMASLHSVLSLPRVPIRAITSMSQPVRIMRGLWLDSVIHGAWHCMPRTTRPPECD
jgi:hypothetical protein